jgi:parallel beta-helix repeat protein
MKLKRKSNFLPTLITIGILLVLSSIISTNLKFKSNLWEINTQDGVNTNSDLEGLQLSVTSGKIHIDDNWTAAKSVGICTGEGTSSNPYIIQNFEIDTGGSGDGILIENSLAYFIIRNCIISNSVSYAGIKLYNVKNGEITDNEFTNCGIGIELSTNYPGDTSHMVISSNNLHNNGAGIQLYGASITDVIGNTINNNDYGISFSYGDYNLISENSITDNTFGIYSYANWDYESEHNTISNNLIQDNSDIGVLLNDYVNLNYVFLNCFIDNGLNANDQGSNNQWDNGVKGNYWSDYTGSDSNNDGIGDTPYVITGSAGSQDNFPLMECPLSSGFPIFLIVVISVIAGGSVALGLTVFLLIRRKKNRSNT